MFWDQIPGSKSIRHEHNFGTETASRFLNRIHYQIFLSFDYFFSRGLAGLVALDGPGGGDACQSLSLTCWAGGVAGWLLAGWFCLLTGLAGWRAGWLGDGLDGRQAGWLAFGAGWLVDWLAGRWLTGWLADCVSDWLADWLAHWQPMWLHGYMAGLGEASLIATWRRHSSATASFSTREDSHNEACYVPRIPA